MNVTESWLREWSNPDISVAAIAKALTMNGLEVDSVTPVAPPLSGVVVGKIVSTEPHPNADKLKITRVDVGEEETLQIVCGAPNAREGILVPTAKVGAVLPGDFAIKSAKLRGTESFGMLCSAKELGISEEASGLHELGDSAEIGRNIREELSLDDHVIEVDLTPNRGDCLSLRGVARELCVRTGAAFTPIEIVEVPEASKDTKTVHLEAPSACPRYVGRLIQGIRPNVSSPAWIQKRLEQVGVKSHSLVVDVTNYVMLSIGQPMHAFDASTLHGDISVRMSTSGEKFTLLNDKTVDIKEHTLLITDEEGPIAIAGVMGGARTECQENTTDVFLESAFFAPEVIAGKAREYGLQTDASHRFERGVSLDLQQQAIELATQLILEHAGGEAGPVTVTESSDHLPRISDITLRRNQISRKLGISIPDENVNEILQRLEIKFEKHADAWSITPPPWRFDIRIEDDLVEELGRIYGYDQIPTTTPAINIPRPHITESSRKAAQIRHDLVGLGYSEIVAYSFITDAQNRVFYDNKNPISLANPISQEMSSMRTSLLPGLLKTLAHNQTRQQSNLRLFDMGICFDQLNEDDHLPQQSSKLAGVVFGNNQAESWHQTHRPVDFFEVKGDVEALLSPAINSDKLTFVAKEISGFHPGQCAEIHYQGNVIGVLGKLHPKANKTFSIKGDVFAYEIELSYLLNQIKPAYQKLAKFPSSRRDIAIVVDNQHNFASIKEAITSLKIDTLRDVFIFDVYQGDSLPENHSSLALGLIFQSDTDTLKDTEIDEHITAIVGKLKQEFRATLRD